MEFVYQLKKIKKRRKGLPVIVKEVGMRGVVGIVCRNSLGRTAFENGCRVSSICNGCDGRYDGPCSMVDTRVFYPQKRQVKDIVGIVCRGGRGLRNCRLRDLVDGI